MILRGYKGAAPALLIERAQRGEAHSNGWKPRHGKSHFYSNLRKGLMDLLSR
jgi:hypothetical protein